MIIDTTTRANFKSTLLQCFRIDELTLSKKLECFFSNCKNKNGTDWDKYDTIIEEFILNSGHEKIEKIQFFHLTRKLNCSSENTTNNLLTLLTEKTPLSEFLEEYELKFKKHPKGHIGLEHKGELLDFTDLSDTKEKENSYCYLRRRLGYDKEMLDFCVNGLSFFYKIEQSHYFRNLLYGPEFIQKLAEYLNIDNLISDYFNKSSYQCIQYNVPFDMIIFDGLDHIYNTDAKKETLFLRKSLELFKYDERGNYGNYDNLILRLYDDCSASSDFFVSTYTLDD